ncbi:MAG TPA: hypothetical protein VIL49_10975, partial [Capillimicrobium sp.]
MTAATSLASGITAAAAAALIAAAGAQANPAFRPGAPGIGDPYVPSDGNGGYDVRHYRLDLRYTPRTDRLSGVATIRSAATQDLSRFNLDLVGLDVRRVTVDGRRAGWSRRGGELIVRPRRGLRRGTAFEVAISYGGVPEPTGRPVRGGQSGFIHTDDGALIAGQMGAARTWFPVNDHPRDKAAYTFRLTVPAGLTAVANGALARRRTRGGATAWTWRATDPMAPYLTTAAIGRFELRAYRRAGIRLWDAIDPDLRAGGGMPRTGAQLALSQRGNLAYRRLMRTIDVPAEGGRLSFWVRRDTEPADLVFVEARRVGGDDWTMLPDLNGHTRARPGPPCAHLLDLHPFLGHYAARDGDGRCTREGTTGRWWASRGTSDGYEHWSVDLSAYAGSQIELSISYVTDDSVTYDGVFVDDIAAPAGAGST